MVSHEYKCIFIHIPKCAGTSIELALGHHTDYAGRGKQDHRTIRQLMHPLPAKLVVSSTENLIEALRSVRNNFRRMPNPRNSLTVTKLQYESYLKFSFVRNPWARAYSWYANVMRDDIHKRVYGLMDDVTFPDYLKANVGKGLLRPQIYWLQDYSGSIAMDFIGKFENLAEDYEIVCRRLGIDKGALPHEIRGASEDYRSHYDNASISIIRKIYHEEIKLFGYSF